MGILATLPRAETADRRFTIGASEAAAALGLSPWQSKMGLFLAKTEEDNTPRADNAVQKRGRYLEPALLQWAADETGAKAVERGPAFDEPGIQGPEPFMVVRPDGALGYDLRAMQAEVFGHADLDWELAEVKTSRMAEEWGADGSDLLPQHYLIQGQYQLACIPGINAVRFPVYLPIADRFLVMRVERDEEFIRWMVDEIGEFMFQHICKGIAPPIDHSEASKAFLRKRFPRETEPMRDASDEEVRLVLDLQKAKAAAKAAKETEELLGNQLREAIGAAEGLVVGDKGKATFRWQAGARRIDADKLRTEFADAAAACTVQGEPFRSLRFSGKGLKE